MAAAKHKINIGYLEGKLEAAINVARHRAYLSHEHLIRLANAIKLHSTRLDGRING